VAYLGYKPVTPRTEETSAKSSNVVIASNADRKVNLYQLAANFYPRGTRVGPADGSSPSTVLGAEYFMYWADPNPVARLGHKTNLIFLRRRDGLVIEQDIDFDPIVDGLRVLELPSQQVANLCYTHQYWIDLGASPLSPPPPFVNPKTLETVSLQGLSSTGSKVAGLIVLGAPDRKFFNDTPAFASHFKAIFGRQHNGELDGAFDDEGHRLTEAEVIELLRQQNQGLGPDDKFCFYLSSHGSKTGSFSLGGTLVTWERLCQILDENVKAGNLNLLIDTCYCGQALPVFLKWQSTSDKRVRIATATGSATPSYFGYNLQCLIDAQKSLIEQAKSDGQLTLEELEQIYLDAEVSQAQLESKICGPTADPEFKERYKNDPTSGSGSVGFDKRPGKLLQVDNFFTKWAQKVAQEDGPGLVPFYSENYDYNGQDRNDLTTFGPGFDINIPFEGSLSFDSLRLVATRSVRVDTTVGGPIPLIQHEDRQMVFRLLETGPEGFEISTQRVAAQAANGTIGTTPPNLPLRPTIIRALTGLDGIQASPGQTLHIEAEIVGLFDGSNPEERSNVGVSLGHLHFAMQAAGGNLFSTNVTLPELAARLYVLGLFCENRRTQNGSQAYSGETQTVEIEIRP
jgi:hypothetical protein